MNGINREMVYEFPKFDAMIQMFSEGLQYPEAKGNNMQCHAGDVDWKGKVVYMTPDKFLKLAAKLSDEGYSPKSMENIRSRFSKQLPTDPLILYVDMSRKKVTGHEGRHRARVAQEMGIEKVPVFVFTGSCYKRTPKWTPEEHEEIDKAEFEPELPR